MPVALGLALAGCGAHAARESRVAPLPRLPPLTARPAAGAPSAGGVYAAARAGRLEPRAAAAVARVYVPETNGNRIDVIDPRSLRVVRRFSVPREPEHVTPSYDLRTLWVDSDLGNALTPIDPRTGRAGRPRRVADPYNLYFAPGGRRAIVVAERLSRLDFRDARTLRMRRSLHVPCPGVNHMDFTADGRLALVSCEFGARLIAVDLARERMVRTVGLPAGSMPQDVKLAPDGRTFYVADMMRGGVWLVDASSFREAGFIPTGRGAHGLFVSRDTRRLYVTNRSEGSIAVISFARRRVVGRWRLPGGGSPDMGGLSVGGRTLWVSGRYDAVVYAIDTVTGRLRARIRVGSGPHGLCVWPQPGRYSLGHTGVMR